MRASTLMSAALTVAVGVALFLLKYEVQALEHELVAKQEQIIRDQSAIRVLQAEWTYLNDPERLRRLSEEYLGFRPAGAQNVTEFGALPLRRSTTKETPVETPASPEFHAEIGTSTNTDVSPANRPSVVSVAIARMQRLLLPTAAGATTMPEAAQ